ncbi:unnamed protein product [Echinostoma caproni]|uniref:RRM domain-containing protein n=1 Tax=Echinostoma caproni TaxID=27848 RepID=A0A183AE23_9TREM|nr:unnamed protein product [Echinostoma caproni]
MPHYHQYFLILSIFKTQIDDDFIARYQMNYGSDLSQVSSGPGENPSHAAGPVDWTDFNAKLARLREEKGDDSEEVQQLTKAAHESLNAYYNSPAYREWYEAYCKQKEITVPKQNQTVQVSQNLPQKSKKLRYDLKPSERMRGMLDADGEDPDEALARAEAELQAGIPLVSDLRDAPHPSTDTALESDKGNETSTNPGNQTTINPTQADGTVESKKTSAAKRKQIAPPPAWYEIDESKNTHVYVSGFPPTITQKEFQDLMSKYGVIMNEPFTNKPRAKLYLDESGQPKGDGRCCYVKVESVELALKILDGMVYAPGYTLHVERAKFQPKGEFDPKKRRRLTLKEKKKLREQQESLFRWGIDTSKFVRGKKERVLILKNAFVETDFLTNPLGAVSVTFSTAEEADTALAFLNGALFNYPGSGGARQLHVERWDGKTNYSVQEDKDEEKSRINNWEEYLGGGESSSEEDEGTNPAPVTETDVALASATTHSPSSNRRAPMEEDQDYWDTSSPERADTDDELNAGGSSGDETA